MAAMASKRQYDFVLLGATGYTGKLCAEYITTSLPTNVKWAVAGRSLSKLQDLVLSLKRMNSDRSQPDVLQLELTATDLKSLAQKTKIILNTIGPYFLYSTPIVEACANSGTHYLDVTDETPWVREIIRKYETTAKANRAILIPEIGIESAPSDLVAYVATKEVRETWDCGVMDMVCALHELRSAGASGGTLATGLGLMDAYSGKEINEALGDPFVLSPTKIRPEPTTYSKSAFTKFFGVIEFAELGTLTTSITSPPNVAIVHRSAGLRPTFYGFNFTFEEYMAVSNTFVGIIVHLMLVFAMFMLSITPIRWIAKKLVTQPGAGPSSSKTKSDVLDYRALAIAEQLGKPRKALAQLRYEGGLYALTGIFLAEGAMTLLDQSEKLLEGGGGFLTPSSLGDAYVSRLQKAGVQISVKRIGDIGSK